MSQLVDIFLQPTAVFAAQRERPTFLVPFLLVAALSAAFTLAYFMLVDPAWYADHMFDASGVSMSPEEMERAKASMPGARVMGIVGAIGGVVAIAATYAITALYVWLVARVVGHALTYRHGLSLAAWSSMPIVLGLLVGLVGALMMEPRTSIESLALTNIDPLLVDLPADHRWNRLAQSFNLLSLWSIALMAIGWRVWTRSSWLQAVIVALVPTLLFLGILALLP